MKSREPIRLPKITVVVPARNAESTILETFEGIRIQEYPVTQVIFVDNVSTDGTVERAQAYAAKHPSFPLRIIKNKKNLMVAGSFNKSIRMAKTPYIVTMHGDCRFTTGKELRKLIMPIARDPSIIATYGLNETPLWVWKEYSFWEKCLMAVHAGKPTPGLAGKIDCYRRKTLLSIGGYDEVTYREFGGEDADLHLRLREKGAIVATDAKTLHLHYLDKNFSLLDWISKKKATAKTYGRLLRVQRSRLGIKGIMAFLLKPILAVGVLVPGLTFITLPALLIFIFWYYQIMFLTPETLHNPRIILLPVVAIFLVYYETFWIIAAFFQRVDHTSYGKI